MLPVSYTPCLDTEGVLDARPPLDESARDGVVARESGDWASQADVLGRGGNDGRIRLGRYSAGSDTARLGVEAVGALAGSHGSIEESLVSPAVEEIAVQAVTGGVTHGPDQVLVIREGGGVIEELVEDRVDGLGVRLRADTSVVVTEGGEGHVAGVVCAVEVDSIPAGREEGLGSHPLAWLGRETVVVGRIGAGGQADVLDSLLRRARGVKRPKLWVANNHAEPSGRGGGVEVAWANSLTGNIITSTVEIVDGASLESDHIELPIRPPVVQLRLPVVAVVDPPVTGSRR